MPTVDERIVEMRFENEQFEKGVKESRASLEQLKSSLRLEDAAKSVAESLDAISYRFSIVGIAVEQLTKNITNSFYEMTAKLKNTVMDLSFNQVGEGFGKYERKLQSVQTIINATGKSIDEVNVSLNKLNWFTDETSYDFTSMVDNIGKFTSNQIPLETAVTSMIGIADAAGLAGASVTDASHAMDGFSKAMGQGYMSRQNWQWIRTAHMDTAKFKETLIEAAAEAGTLKKIADGIYETEDGLEVTVANFEEGLKDKWMNVGVMNKALAKFGGTTEKIYQQYLETGQLTSDIIESMGDMGEDLGLKAFKAAQEAKTFTDAINSVKDAVSTGWMTSFEYIFGNYEEAKVMWTNLANEMWDVFNGGAEDRNELLRSWHYDFKGYESMLRSIGNIWEGIQNAILPITDAFRKFFPATTVEQLANITRKVEEFSVKFRDYFGKAGAVIWPFIEEAEDAADAVTGGVETVTKTVKKMVEVVEQVEGPVARTAKVLDQLAYAVWRGDYGNGQERIDKLRELGYSYELVQNRVNELIEIQNGWAAGTYIRHKVIDDEVKTITKQVEVEEEVTEAVEDEIDVIKRYVNEVPRKTTVMWNLSQAFTGLFAAARLVVDVIKAVGKGLTPLLKIGIQLFEIMTSVGAIIGQVVTEIVKYIYQTGILEKITNLLQTALNKVSKALEPVVDWFANAAQNVHTFGERIRELWNQIKLLDSVQVTIGYFREFGELIKQTVTKNFTKFVDKAKELIKLDLRMPKAEDLLKLVDEAAKKFNKFIEYLKGQNPGEAVEGWWANIAQNAGGIWQGLLATIQDPNSIFSKAFESAKQFGQGLVEGLNELKLDDLLSVLSTGSLAYFVFSFATALRGLSKALGSVDLGQFDSLMTSIRGVLTSVSKNFKADSYIKMAKAIGILAIAMLGLAQLNKEELARVTVSVVGVMLALSWLARSMAVLNDSKIASSANGIISFLDGMKFAFAQAFMWSSFGIMLVGMATSIVIFAKALRDLIEIVNESNGDDLKDTGLLLLSLLGGFTAFVLLISALTKNMNAAQKLGFGKIFFDMGVGLAMMALAIKLLVGPLGEMLTMFKTATQREILAGFGGIIILAGALAGVAYALSKSEKSGVYLMAFGAGLMFVAFAIKLLTPMLQEFWHWFVDFNKGPNFGLFVAALGAAAVSMSVIIVLASIFKDTLQPLGILLLGIGAAALGIGLGIRIAGDSLEAFAKGFVGMAKVIADNKLLVVGAVTTIITAILSAVAKNKAKLVWTFVSVFMGISEAISIVGPDVIETIGEQIMNAVDYTMTILDEMVRVLIYVLVQAIHSLADAIDENRKPILDAIERLLDALHDLIQDAIKRLLPGISDGFASFAASMTEVVAIGGPFVSIIGKMIGAFQSLSGLKLVGLLPNLKDIGPFLKTGLTGISNTFLGGFGVTGSMALMTKDLGSALDTGIQASKFYNYKLGELFHTNIPYTFMDEMKDSASIVGSTLTWQGAVIGTAAIAGSLLLIGKHLQNIRNTETEEIRNRNKLTEAGENYINQMGESYEEYTQKADDLKESIASVVKEHKGYKELAKEYDKLIDSNGKIIEGNEQTADNILNKLSEALGVEKTQLQDLVTEHGNLQSAIAETIRMKEAEALLGTMQDDYLDALTNRNKAQADVNMGRSWLSYAENNLNKAKARQEEYAKQRDKYANSELNDDKLRYAEYSRLYENEGVAVAQLQANYDELAEAYDQASERLEGYESTISTYTKLENALTTGEAKSVEDLLKLIERDVPDSIKRATNSTKEELAEQYNALSFGFKELKSKVDSGNSDVTESMVSGSADLLNIARNEFLKAFGLFDENGKFCAEAYTNSVKEELIGFSPDLVEYIETNFKPALAADTSEEGAETASTYKEGMLSVLTSGDDISTQVEAIKNLFNIETSSEGVESADEYLAGMVNQLSSGEISVDSAIGMLTEHFNISDETSKLAEDAVNSAAQSATDNAEVVDTAMEDVVTGAVDVGVEVAKKESPDVGKYSMLGVADGMRETAGEVAKATSEVASSIPAWMKKLLGIESPSKVGMEIGRFWDLGLARGMINNISSIIGGSHTVSQTMIDSMRNAVRTAYDLMSDTGDLNPTITPVLDLSEIQNGTSMLNGMFGNRSFALAASNGIRFEANRLDALNKLETQSTNADVVAALGLLRGDVNNLNDSFANTQVVLDSGALVGATAKQMDNALGRIKVYKGRGI